MMADLYSSLIFMGLLSAAAVVAGSQAAGTGSPRVVIGSQAVAAVLMLVYMSCLWERPLLAQLLPFSSTIVLGNWLPVLGCFCSGICLRTLSIRLWRRVLLSSLLCGLAGYSLVSPLLGESPMCFTLKPTGALHFQTSDNSCSAAAAASLLRMHGIRAKEAEMVELCLTREGGTRWLGVFRGLKLKTAETEWDVVVEDFCSTRHLAEHRIMPGVLSLTFHSRSGSQHTATGESPSTGHSVVSLESFGDGSLNVFDPSPEFGFETWHAGFLNDVRSGVLLRLVRRDPDRIPQTDPSESVRAECTGQTFASK
jgi:hypothetical protein